MLRSSGALFRGPKHRRPSGNSTPLALRRWLWKVCSEAEAQSGVAMTPHQRAALVANLSACIAADMKKSAVDLSRLESHISSDNARLQAAVEQSRQTIDAASAFISHDTAGASTNARSSPTARDTTATDASATHPSNFAGTSASASHAPNATTAGAAASKTAASDASGSTSSSTAATGSAGCTNAASRGASASTCGMATPEADAATTNGTCKGRLLRCGGKVIAHILMYCLLFTAVTAFAFALVTVMLTWKAHKRLQREAEELERLGFPFGFGSSGPVPMLFPPLPPSGCTMGPFACWRRRCARGSDAASSASCPDSSTQTDATSVSHVGVGTDTGKVCGVSANDPSCQGDSSGPLRRRLLLGAPFGRGGKVADDGASSEVASSGAPRSEGVTWIVESGPHSPHGRIAFLGLPARSEPEYLSIVDTTPAGEVADAYSGEVPIATRTRTARRRRHRFHSDAEATTASPLLAAPVEAPAGELTSARSSHPADGMWPSWPFLGPFGSCGKSSSHAHGHADGSKDSSAL